MKSIFAILALLALAAAVHGGALDDGARVDGAQPPGTSGAGAPGGATADTTPAGAADTARTVFPDMGPPPTGEEILRRLDENLLVDAAVSENTMIVHGRSGTRTITSRTWKKGKDRAFVEYLSPPREAGKKMLRLGDKLWTYTPEPNDRIIAISGHLLRQSVMGSDFSYEDITENYNLADEYEASVIGGETLDGRPAWKVEMTAKTADVPYHRRIVWVDAERWLPLREERYAKSGRLLKTTRITDVFRQDGRWYPKRMIFKDELQRGEGTEYVIESIDFDADVPEYLLTKAALRK
jgi:outer membrane lipoprotein-sorting protein